jgi:signal transduction histidine kinase/CheY-like chemotaxis protein
MAEIAEAIRQRADHHVEYRIVRSDGETRWIGGHGQLFVDPTGEPDRIIGVCVDITAHRLVEEALQAATRDAKHASELKDQFLATVSHELRSPLNAVLGWAEMLRIGMLDDAERQRAVQAVYVNAKQQTQLLDDLLDISSMVSGRVRVTRSVVDLRAVVRAALDAVKLAADAKQVTTTADIDDAIDSVVGDAGRLQQILFNLLMNAVKFSADGAAVHLSVRRVAQVVEIVVTDTGEGIPAEFLPRLFEPFSQADSSTTRTHGGLGVGLAIVKYLVEAHGGTVGAESAGEAQGSRFTVRLPIAAAFGEDASTASLPADRARGHVLSLHNVRILVVDDNADSRDVVASIMEAAHATVGTATSAAEALAKLQREHVDVLLADIAMPGEDGYELIAKVRAMDSAAKAVPAIALTAFAGQNDRQEALRAGFHAHLSKPIDARTLIEAVAGLVNRIASH